MQNIIILNLNRIYNLSRCLLWFKPTHKSSCWLCLDYWFIWGNLFSSYSLFWLLLFLNGLIFVSFRISKALTRLTLDYWWFLRDFLHLVKNIILIIIFIIINYEIIWFLWFFSLYLNLHFLFFLFLTTHISLYFLIID